MDDILAVLRAYPQIYLACHVEHRTRGSSETGLTSREASFLAHIDDPEGTSPAALARHLGIGRPSLSAALARLEGLGLVSAKPDPEDARRKRIRLTEAGRRELDEIYVLDSERVRALLAAFAPEARRRAVDGLVALAAAARRMREKGESGC